MSEVLGWYGYNNQSENADADPPSPHQSERKFIRKHRVHRRQLQLRPGAMTTVSGSAVDEGHSSDYDSDSPDDGDSEQVRRGLRGLARRQTDRIDARPMGDNAAKMRRFSTHLSEKHDELLAALTSTSTEARLSDTGDSAENQTIDDEEGCEVALIPSGAKSVCCWCRKLEVGLYTLTTSNGKVKVFCSDVCFTLCRRASFKKSKICDWCKHVRHTLNYVDFQNGEQQLQFCTDKCLNQYKMNLFRKETEAHLKLITRASNGLSPGKQPAPNSSSSKGQEIDDALITPALWLKTAAEGGDAGLARMTDDRLAEERKSPVVRRSNGQLVCDVIQLKKAKKHAQSTLRNVRCASSKPKQETKSDISINLTKIRPATPPSVSITLQPATQPSPTNQPMSLLHHLPPGNFAIDQVPLLPPREFLAPYLLPEFPRPRFLLPPFFDSQFRPELLPRFQPPQMIRTPEAQPPSVPPPSRCSLLPPVTVITPHLIPIPIPVPVPIPIPIPIPVVIDCEKGSPRSFIPMTSLSSQTIDSLLANYLTNGCAAGMKIGSLKKEGGESNSQKTGVILNQSSPDGGGLASQETADTDSRSPVDLTSPHRRNLEIKTEPAKDTVPKQVPTIVLPPNARRSKIIESCKSDSITGEGDEEKSSCSTQWTEGSTVAGKRRKMKIVKKGNAFVISRSHKRK